ncbi:MAG: hypothetical protein AB7H90_14980 [Alphaproteobacteria bacterium]
MTTIEDGSGVVNVKVAAAGEYAGTGRVRLADIEADLNFSDGLADATLRIPSARLWSPQDPHLYPLTAMLIASAAWHR